MDVKKYCLCYLIMPKASEKEKAFSFLEKEVGLITAINNPKLAPYIETFRHYPENILMQSLGVLSGFFKINDFSEESAYIVNFLSSILKKEYYANPKRPIESSFDSALRKVNLALSEIAKEGNISWLGKIDGCVCILEKNNLHFSVCGGGRVFLFRNQVFTEISKDMADLEEGPNPLKTFENVSSGRLEKDDKILICSDDIFEVLSIEDIRKEAVRQSKNKFSQFMKTALINSLDAVGAIIIDVFEKKEEKKEEIPEKIEVSNVFSKKAFEKQQPPVKGLNELLKEETGKKEYTDEKTGHIYIQEGAEEAKKESETNLQWFLFKERLLDTFYWSKNKAKRRFLLFGRSIEKLKDSTASKMATMKEERKKKKELAIAEALAKKEDRRIEEEKQLQAKLKMQEEQKRIQEEKRILEEKKKKEERKILADLTEKKIQKEDFLPAEEQPTGRAGYMEVPQFIKEKSKYFGIKTKDEPTISPIPVVPIPKPEREKIPIKERIAPSFQKIKYIFSLLTLKQKLYSGIAIILIILVPFVFIKIQNAQKAASAPTTQESAPSPKEILSEEKNIIFLDNLNRTFEGQNFEKVLTMNEKLIAIGPDKILVRGEETKESDWPSNFGSIKEVSPMKDLNLVLILTDQDKIISYSPTSSQFKENNIQIPDQSKITGMGTYLTYLYLIDAQNNQIYRYPRAEGGFGERTNWFKENFSLSDSCCLAIDENLYLLDEGRILKLFKGQNQGLNLEATANNLEPAELYTDSDIQNIYVLDTNNSRVVKYSKNGEIISQYFNENIKNATDFSVDEAGKKVYLIISGEINSFDLQ